MFIGRRIERRVSEIKGQYPVLAITGPRQSGKTTLLKNLFSDYRYLTLEDPDIREFAENDPVAFLDMYDQYVILDEVQRVPRLFSYLQGRVDASGLMAQYILSGSQNFHLIQNITQTLAGRVVLFKLLPLDFTELNQAKLLSDDFVEMAIKGAYPAIFSRGIDPAVFYRNYVETYVERDVTELLRVKDTRQFKQFIKLCANRAGQLLNVNALSNEAGVAYNTAKEWLSILESSYIVFFLQPYYENRNKRLVKSPKLYFYDTGLLCFLLGIGDKKKFFKDRHMGNVFENMIISEHQKALQHMYLNQELYFWQDSNGVEVDLLWKNRDIYFATEIKATKTIKSDLFHQLDKFESYMAPDIVKKNLVYGGNESQKRTDYTVVSWRGASEGYGM